MFGAKELFRLTKPDGEIAHAEILIEPNDQPHGERQCRFRDPFGHEWLLGHELEKLSPEEMQRKFDESFND